MAFRNEAFSFFTHAGGAIAAAVGLVLLLREADGIVAQSALSVYGGTMMLMFTTSALHHVAHAEEGLFRKLDMSAIYLFIAGTYTPFCLLAVEPTWGLPMLVVIWLFAITGVVLRWTLPKTPRWVTATIYLVMGWSSLVGIYPLFLAVGLVPVLLLGLGGVIYSVGAVIYARKRPDPIPQYVGHHGLWHLFVLAGAAVHFALVWTIAA